MSDKKTKVPFLSASLNDTIREEIQKILKYFKNKAKVKRNLIEKIELTILYIYIYVLQLYTVANILGEMPHIYYEIFPGLQRFSGSAFSIIKLLASPEKTFIFYFVLLEFVVYRPIINFSIIVRFNIVYVFSLELLQNLVFAYIEFLFTRDFDKVVIHKGIINPLVWNVYLVVLITYIYSYCQAMRGRLPRLPFGCQKIVDSVAFWLKLKRIDKEEE